MKIGIREEKDKSEPRAMLYLKQDNDTVDLMLQDEHGESWFIGWFDEEDDELVFKLCDALEDAVVGRDTIKIIEP